MKTIEINGYEVPKPMDKYPNIGSIFYTPKLDWDYLSEAHIWSSHQATPILFNLGLCHETEEAAIIHAKALLSFTRRDK